MSSTFGMNQFRYIIGATREIKQGFIVWSSKIREYVNLYYQGNEENALGTEFYKCILKTRQITNNLLDREDFFRGVIDDQNLLACVCIIQETSILFDEERLNCLEIESLTNLNKYSDFALENRREYYNYYPNSQLKFE